MEITLMIDYNALVVILMIIQTVIQFCNYRSKKKSSFQRFIY